MALIGNPIVVGYNNAGQGQGYGTCSTATSATGARIATLANYNLQTGGIVSIYFDNDVPANAQLNINSKGQKDIYYRGGAIAANVIKSRDIATFMYDGTRYQLISLDRWGSSPNFTGTPTAPTAASTTNTTQIATTEFVHNLVDPKSGGYAVCSTASSTAAKVVSIDNYELVTGGLVTIKFTYAVPAGATLNINSKGAKAIYFKDSIMASPTAIDASTIRAGDICTFVYDGTRYVLTNIDRWGVPASTSRSGIMSAADKTALNTAVSNIGDMQEMNTDATTLAGGIGELKGSLNTKLPHLESTGDTTDRYTEIMQCLNTYGCCILGNGVFYINSTIGMPNNTTLSGVGVNTVLQLANNAAGQVAINVGSYCLVKDMTIKGNSTELPYSSYTRGTRKGIALLGDYSDFNEGTYSHNFAKLSNLTITDFNHSGIWAYKNDGGSSFLAENIDILRCHTGINIELFSEFHSFTNIRCRWCNIACVMQGGNNIFTNCHFDVNLSNIECDDSQNNLVNSAHSTFIGCSFCHPNNNSGYNIWIKGSTSGWIFSNCQFWYGIIRFENTTGIMLTNNIIGGSNNTIIMTNCTQVIVADNIFKTQIPTVNIGGTNAAWLNNLNPDGSINFRPYYSSLSDVRSVYKYTGSLSSYVIETLGVCYESNKWRVTLPLGFVGVGTRNVTITRIVLIGLGTVADLTGINVTASDTYVRIDNIPYSGNVNDLAFINVMMDYSLT